MKKLFPRIEVLGTLDAQHMRKAFVGKGKLDGCPVMKVHTIVYLRFQSTSPAMFDMSPGHVEPVDGERRKVL